MPSVSEILLDEKMENKEDKAETIAEKRAAAEKKAEQDAQVFIKRTKKAVRRMMIRMGVVVGIVVLAIVLTVMFVIPKIANRFYYDPMNANGSTFTKDMAVYSRMFMPDKNWYGIEIESNGYGEYDLAVTYLKADGITNKNAEEYISGKLSKGKLDMNGSDIFERSYSYPFRPEYAGVFQNYRKEHSGGSSVLGVDENVTDKSLKALSELDDDTYYNAYIIFQTPLTLREVHDFNIELYNDNYEVYNEGIWWAVCRKNEEFVKNMETPYERSFTMGFFGRATDNGVPQYFYNDKSSSDGDMWSFDADDSTIYAGINEMTKNYIEAVRYMAQRSDFFDMINKDYSFMHFVGFDYKTYMNEFADDLEKNGIYVYGCRVNFSSGESLKNLARVGNIAYVYTEIPRS